MPESFLIKTTIIKSLIPATNFRCFYRPITFSESKNFTMEAEKEMKHRAASKSRKSPQRKKFIVSSSAFMYL
jgi:hypothetical protein